MREGRSVVLGFYFAHPTSERRGREGKEPKPQQLPKSKSTVIGRGSKGRDIPQNRKWNPFSLSFFRVGVGGCGALLDFVCSAVYFLKDRN